MPTQDEIDEALKKAEIEVARGVFFGQGYILAAAYRAEKARADLLERQLKEACAHGSGEGIYAETWGQLLDRHVTERAALGR